MLDLLTNLLGIYDSQLLETMPIKGKPVNAARSDICFTPEDLQKLI